MSCNFMPCYLVRHFHVLQFHVRHFQRPRAKDDDRRHRLLRYILECHCYFQFPPTAWG